MMPGRMNYKLLLPCVLLVSACNKSSDAPPPQPSAAPAVATQAATQPAATAPATATAQPNAAPSGSAAGEADEHRRREFEHKGGEHEGAGAGEHERGHRPN